MIGILLLSTRKIYACGNFFESLCKVATFCRVDSEEKIEKHARDSGTATNEQQFPSRGYPMSTHTQSRTVRQSSRHETTGRSPHFETPRSTSSRDTVFTDKSSRQSNGNKSRTDSAVRLSRNDSVATADESQVLRYNRIANLEAVLSIREHRQRSARMIAFWSIVLMMGTLALAAVLEM